MYGYFDLGTLYGDFMYGLLDCVEVESDPRPFKSCYGRTNYRQFPTYQSFYDYVSFIFSDSLRDELLNRGLYQNINGYLYVSDANRGSHEYFLKETYELIKESDELIQFYVIGHYFEDHESREEKEIKKSLVELSKFDNKWKFTKFSLAY